MVLPLTGQMSATMINGELKKPLTSTFPVGAAFARKLARVPSGTIRYSDFYGKANEIDCEIFVVSGGGGGGAFNGGGGGAGVYVPMVAVDPGVSYQVLVGRGGRCRGRDLDVTRLDAKGTTRVTLISNEDRFIGETGGESRVGSIVRATGGTGGGSRASQQNGITGQGTGPSGSDIYQNRRTGVSRGGHGAGSEGSGRQGGDGQSVTMSWGTTYEFGAGGGGTTYWNVSGENPGRGSGGGSPNGGNAGGIKGDRSNGVNPAAGDPAADNGDSYVDGTDATGIGGGGGAGGAGEVLWNEGRYGAPGGHGTGGIVVFAYEGAQVFNNVGGGNVFNVGTKTVHLFDTPGAYSLAPM